MKAIRLKKIESSLQQEISDIIANEVRNDNLKLVTVTDIRLASDLSYAKVYITTRFDENKDQILEELNDAKGFIKNELCQRKFEIRTIPELEFVYDDSLAYADNIERIIKKIHEEE